MSSGNETIVKVKCVHIVGGHAAVDVDALTNVFTSHDLQYFNTCCQRPAGTVASL